MLGLFDRLSIGADDAAKMNRWTPACRAASSMLSVDVGPLACDESGSRTDRGTLGIAA